VISFTTEYIRGWRKDGRYSGLRSLTACQRTFLQTGSYILDTAQPVASQSSTRSANTSSGLTPESTKEIVEGIRARHAGWPLEMLIPLNVEAVAKELSDAGAH
jgi:hypothetical protein